MDEIQVRHWLITERSGDKRWAKAYTDLQELPNGSVVAVDIETGELGEIPVSIMNIYC